MSSLRMGLDMAIDRSMAVAILAVVLLQGKKSPLSMQVSGLNPP